MADGRVGVFPALLLAGALAFAGWSVGKGLEAFRSADRSVTVKGLAELDVKSDFASWALGFRRAGNEFDQVQLALTADREKVLGFLHEQGFTAEEIEVRPLQVQDLLAREWGGNDVALRFNGQGQVVVKSTRVDLVAEAANQVDPLIQAGVQLAGSNAGFSGPRFQLRGFNDVKPQLLVEILPTAGHPDQRFGLGQPVGQRNPDLVIVEKATATTKQFDCAGGALAQGLFQAPRRFAVGKRGQSAASPHRCADDKKGESSQNGTHGILQKFKRVV